MTKKEAINYINNHLGAVSLRHWNTTYANIRSKEDVWWLNISVEKLVTTKLNVILIDDEEFHWLVIPENTFKKPEAYFYIRQDRNAVNWLISRERGLMFMHDTASGGIGVDFKPFKKQSFPFPSSTKDKSTLDLEGPLNGHTVHKKHLHLNQKHRKILAGETNISYTSLFADYLEGASTIKLQDPYIRQPRQFDNFIEFCQMLKEIKEQDSTIQLDIITWNDNEFQKVSEKNFEEVAEGLRQCNIHLNYKFEKVHDRFIEADNGWKIILGRGLDIFERIPGRYNLASKVQALRKCKSCEVTYIRTES